MMKKIVVTSVLVGCLVGAWTQAGEPTEVYTAEKIAALIKDLGSEVFEKRQTAEKELLKAGPKAQEALKATQRVTTDAQVKVSADRILTSIKLANIGAVNYLDVFPANMIAVVQLPNIKTSAEAYKKTAIGKLIASPELTPLRASIEAEISHNAPEVISQISKWSGRFQGQVVIAVSEEGIAAPKGPLVAMLAEITDPDPVTVYRELMAICPIPNEQMSRSVYKGVATVEMGRGRNGPSSALVGKHLIVTNDLVFLQKMIDGLLAPTRGFVTSPAFLKLKPKLSQNPDYLLMLNLQILLERLAMVMPPGIGITEMLASLGMNEIQMMGLTGTVSGDGFEDRFVMSGTLKGMMASYIPPPTGPALLDVTALMPANTVAAVVGYFDGLKAQTALPDYLAGLKKMMDFQKNMGGEGPDITAKIKEIETKCSIKLDALFANIKGEIGYWVELASPPTSAWPNLGMLVTCADANKAKATASSIARIINAVTGKSAVLEVPLGEPGLTLYQINLAAFDNVPPNFQYSPCWSVADNRIFFASSVPALKKQLANLKTKAPGLLTQPEFVKAIGLLSLEERKGQILYADVKSLLTLTATVGLPMLQSVLLDKSKTADLKKALATLPNPQELFKNLSALMCSSIYEKDQAQMIVRSPVGLVQIYGLSVGAAGVVSYMMAMRMREGRNNAGQGVQIDIPQPPPPAPRPSPDDF
ncbi:MAG: hypothetical protein V1899_06550 [Planctomycetota bacterium]